MQLQSCHIPPLEASMAPHYPLNSSLRLAGPTHPISRHLPAPTPQLCTPDTMITSSSSRASGPLRNAVPSRGRPSHFFMWLQASVQVPLFQQEARASLPSESRPGPHRGAISGLCMALELTLSCRVVSVGDSCVGPMWAWGDRGCGCPRDRAEWVGLLPVLRS